MKLVTAACMQGGKERRKSLPEEHYKAKRV